MPEGSITSFDEKSGQGEIEPAEGGGKVMFRREALKDHHLGELVTVGDQVTYEAGEGGGEATSVHRLTPRGYS